MCLIHSQGKNEICSEKKLPSIQPCPVPEHSGPVTDGDGPPPGRDPRWVCRPHDLGRGLDFTAALTGIRGADRYFWFLSLYIWLRCESVPLNMCRAVPPASARDGLAEVTGTEPEGGFWGRREPHVFLPLVMAVDPFPEKSHQDPCGRDHLEWAVYSCSTLRVCCPCLFAQVCLPLYVSVPFFYSNCIFFFLNFYTWNLKHLFDKWIKLITLLGNDPFTKVNENKVP